MIRKVEINDALSICDIYNFYVKNTTISFEEEEINVAQMKERIKSYKAKLPWIVYEEDGEIIGYAYATSWKARRAYRHTAETTVYIKGTKRRHGVGTKLYKEIIQLLPDYNIHTVIGVIALPNELSVKLHENLGFEKVAHFKEVGYKFDKWVDVGYWQYNY